MNNRKNLKVKFFNQKDRKQMFLKKSNKIKNKNKIYIHKYKLNKLSKI